MDLGRSVGSGSRASTRSSGMELERSLGGRSRYSTSSEPIVARRGTASPERTGSLDDDNDNDSLSKSPGSKSSSRAPRTSASRRTFAAPKRPPQFATRPSHVSIKTDRMDHMTDESLIGVVEGGRSFHRSQRNKVGPDISVVGIQKADKSKTAWGKVKKCFVLLLKVALVAGFIVYGVFLIMNFNGYKMRSGEPSAVETLNDAVEEERTGERNQTSQSGGVTNDIVTLMTGQASLSAHLTHDTAIEGESDAVHVAHQDLDHDRINELAQVILEHQVSIPEALIYTDEILSNLTGGSPQLQSLLWLAGSDAVTSAEATRDVQHLKLLQRYSLAVFYVSCYESRFTKLSAAELKRLETN